MKRQVVALALCGVWTVVLANSQNPGAVAQGPTQAPVFQAGADYVPVDVVVTGADDRPITDLTAADFEVSENGRPQRIADFRFVNVPLAHRQLSATDPPVPGPDVVSNAPASPNSRLFVMIVDDLHLVEGAIAPVKQVMTEFINNLSKDDEAAVLFVGRSDLSQNVTRDPARLLQAVNNVRAAFGFGIGVYVRWTPLSGQNLGSRSLRS